MTIRKNFYPFEVEKIDTLDFQNLDKGKNISEYINKLQILPKNLNYDVY
jgi:hypothetical protein